MTFLMRPELPPTINIDIRPYDLIRKRRKSLLYLFLFVFIPAFIVIFMIGGKYVRENAVAHGASDVRIIKEINNIELNEVREMFDDISIEHPNVYAIWYLAERSIVKGYEDDLFKPDDFVNRAEFIKLLASVMHVYPHSISYGHCYNDVLDQWFAPYVCYAANNEWIELSQSGFNPSASISFAEAVKIAVIALGINVHSDYMAVARNNTWFENMGLDEVSPETLMTRAQVAELLFRIAVLEVPVS